jgi:hypothetical protein
VTATSNTLTLSNQSGAALLSYPFQFGRPFLAGAITSGQCVGAVWTPAGGTGVGLLTQSEVKNRYPDGSVEFAVIAVVMPSIPAGGSGMLSLGSGACLQNSPLTLAQMKTALPVGAAPLTVTPTSTPSQTLLTPQVVDPGQMLINGDCVPWTQGPIAQTMRCADDSPTRKYDMGFGDGYHPLRPRFDITFWNTGQTQVRAIMENGLSTEIEDVAYVAAYGAGQSLDLSNTQTTNPKSHWAGSRWTATWWLGGTPTPQVNIDNNLVYLKSTRFLPNFDTSITVSPSAIATEYANYAQNVNAPYDGLWNQPTDSTTLQNGMANVGARQDLAPYPMWTALWLYTGDWRMRRVSLGLADQAASYPIHVRETDPTKRFLITDPTGVTPAGGYGRVLSHADRQSTFGKIGTGPSGGNGLFNWGIAADNLKAVGPIGQGNPWSWDGAHQPSYFFPQYILTGDPFYLEEMNFWASLTAFNCWGNSANIGQGCGPYPSTGTTYGGAIHDELRGNGWTARNRAETAFANPDGSPEKTYFTALMGEALARWEGGFNIAGTGFDGTPMKVWGRTVGNDETIGDNGPVMGTAPPLHNWESNCSPLNAGSLGCESDGTWAPNADGTYTAPWMQWYDQYALGRVTELGFAAQPIQLYLGKYATDMINVSGIPQLTAIYQMPVERAAAEFTGYISGNTLTVSAMNTANFPNPPIAVGLNVSILPTWGGTCDPEYAANCPVPYRTVITALGTGTGGVGTYTLNNSLTLGSAASPMTLVSGGYFNTWSDLENSAFSPGFLTGTGAWAGNQNALPAYFNANLASDGREVWLTPGLAMLIDQGAPGAPQAWSWWIANVYSQVPDFANDPKWAIVPRIDTNMLPAQPL